MRWPDPFLANTRRGCGGLGFKPCTLKAPIAIGIVDKTAAFEQDLRLDSEQTRALAWGAITRRQHLLNERVLIG
jgi:hypothetical protein